jgi:hypothetical protein
MLQFDNTERENSHRGTLELFLNFFVITNSVYASPTVLFVHFELSEVL